MKHIFTVKNKEKLYTRFTQLLIKAIETKTKIMKKEGNEYNIVDDVIRTKKYVTIESCKSYLQSTTLNIPLTVYSEMKYIYECLDLDPSNNYIDNNFETLDEHYWNIMTCALYDLIQTRMENKFTIYVPKKYMYTVRNYIYYETKYEDYKKAIVNRISTEDTKSFIEHCIFDVKFVTKKQLENMFNKDVVLVRMSSTESILNYREHIKRGYKLVFANAKEYNKIRTQFMES